MPFGNITRISDSKKFLYSIRVIRALSRMLGADQSSKPIGPKTVRRLKQFVKHKMEGENSKIVMDAYPRDLFECFCVHRQTLHIDMFDVQQNEIDAENELFGFAPFFGEFFDEELTFVDLRKMISLFECAESLVIERCDPQIYGELEVATQLMRFICDGLKAVQRNQTFKQLTIAMTIPMVEVNDVCTAKHKLVPFVADLPDWFYCDLCDEPAEEGAQMFGCTNQATKCNYCLCAECYQSENVSVRSLNSAMAEIEPALREMSWSVALIE